MFDKLNYLVKEHVSFLKLTDKYDIIDAETGSIVASAKENISGLIKFFRLLISKQLLPTKVEIKSAGDESILYTMRRPVSFLRSKVFISNKEGKEIGYFKSRLFTIGGHFDVFSMDDRKMAEVKGKWTGWDFKFLDDKGTELGSVTKKWAGLGKELFTSADNYMITLNPGLKDNPQVMPLLIMAGLAIDIVYKERK